MNKSPAKPAEPTLSPTRFAALLLNLGGGISGWAIGAFVSGVLALGLASNLLFSMAYDPASVTWAGVAQVVALFVALVGLAYILYRFDPNERRVSLVTRVDEARLMDPHPGLILLLSPGRPDLAQFVIRHHAGGSEARRLRHCWVVITPGAQEAYKTLQTQVERDGLAVTLQPLLITAATIDASYRAVASVYASLAGTIGLGPGDIVADLTGGTKPMTAGMTLACLPHRHPLEYVESGRDAEGRFVEGSQRVVRVDVAFALRADTTD